MAEGGKQSDYQVLLELQEELVDRIIGSGTSVETIVTTAVTKGLVSMQGLEANAASTARPERERAEQLIAKVLESIGKDPSGKHTKLFLQVFDDLSLSSLSGFIRSKLTETRRDTSHAPPSSSLAHRPGPPHQPRGGAYGGQPKLEPADEEDSGIVREGVTNNNNDNADFGEDVHVVMNAQHKLAPADTGGAAFKPLTDGVVVVQPEHSDNLAVTSEDDPPAIPETQPHTHIPTSSSNPMITGVTSVPVLEQTETEQLRARVEEMACQKECLQGELSQLKIKQEKSEQKLKEKDMELEQVKRERDAQIQSLKAQIKEKEEEMEELQRKLSHQERENVAMKEQYETDIVRLKEQLKEKEKKFNEVTLQLMNEKQQLLDEKHQLELEVKEMCIQEEQLKRQISEERVRSAKLEVKVAEEKQKSAEEKQKRAEEKHRDSVSENKKLREELAKLKKRDTEPDTS